ncbi:hypothetical protein O181_112769, partial [Austropuccinia psidii MF-1]|nr:hypothetical protein [Austropuccinia psidii MF-1]
AHRLELGIYGGLHEEGVKWHIYGGMPPYMSRVLTLNTRFFMLVQVPNAPDTNAYAQCFRCDSLSFSSFPMLHMQFLTLVQVPKASRASP